MFSSEPASTATPDDAEITEWALRAGAGDRAAAAAFIRATQPSVYRFLIHLSGAGEAEDLTQETYLRALRSLPRFAARSSARTWLLAIARRVAVDQVRAAVRGVRVVDQPPGDLPAGPGFAVEDAAILHQLIRDLPTDRREAFVATQVLGLSYAEAAEVCDCPVGTIRSRVARARADLVVALEADTPASPGRGERSAG